MNRQLDFFFGVPLVAALAPFASKKARISEPKKILIIKLAAAGDTILLDPVLRSFRAAHPSTEIHWLVSPINATLAKMNQAVDRIVVWSNGIKGLPALAWYLRKQRYDAVCDLEQWSRGTAVLSFLSGAPTRLGFDTPGQRRAALFTATYGKKFDKHEIDEFYGVLSLLGPLERGREFRLAVTDQAKADIGRHVPEKRGKGPRVLIHPGCGSDGAPREWPLADYGVLAHWLMKKAGADLILSSGPEETQKTAQLNRLVGGAALDLGGKVSWQGLIALVDRVDLVISGNTGVMHVAAALGKKQVALHGPTNPILWGPLNSNAKVIQSPCAQCPCLKLGFEYHSFDSSCMSKIGIAEVKSAVGEFIDIQGGI